MNLAGGKGMFRVKDFLYMDVFDANGKKLGFIKDMIVNYNKGKIEGFQISSSRLFNRSVYALRGDIVTFKDSMIVSRVARGQFLGFNEIKNLDTVDQCGNMIGMIEDMIFEKNDFNIKAVIVSTGFFNNLFNGKRIIPVKQTMLGDEGLMFYGECDKFQFVSVPHKLFKEDESYEDNCE